MAWTEITRRQYRREGLRYESDTMDAEWFVMEPLLPPPSALGRPRETDMRAVMNAILYIASTGCQRRQLPKDFPPYRGEHADGYGYSRFCDLYRAWRGTISPTMRQTHGPAEKLFVDFAGDTVAVFDAATGMERRAHIFVAVLGASNYTYAEARWSEGL